MEKWQTTYNIDHFLDEDYYIEYIHRDYSFSIKKKGNNTVNIYIEGGKQITLSIAEPKAKDVIRELVKDGSLVNKTTDELRAMCVHVSPVKYTYNVYGDEIYKYDGSLDYFGVVYDNEGKEVRHTFIPVSGGIEFSTDSLEQAVEYLTEKANNEPRKLRV